MTGIRARRSSWSSPLSRERLDRAAREVSIITQKRTRRWVSLACVRACMTRWSELSRDLWTSLHESEHTCMRRVHAVDLPESDTLIHMQSDTLIQTASHLPTLPQGSVLAIVYEGSSTYTHSWHHFGFGEILTEFVVKN
jgi:hypothetical protein